jgi:flagella basal body P-ring formation protein FlgA
LLRTDGKKVALLFLCFVFLPALGLTTDMSASVNIIENPSVAGKYIFLGDISIIESPDANIKEKLQKANICPSAEPGSSVTLNIGYIKSRIKQQGIQAESVMWIGSDQATIQTKSTIVSAKEIQFLAESYITGLAGKNAKKITIQSSNDIKPVILPYGKMNTKTELVSPSMVNDNLLIRFTFSIDDKEYEKRIIPFKTEIIRDVIVPSRDINLHKIIGADDLTSVSKNVGLSNKVFFDKNELLGKRTKRLITKETLITSDMIEQPPIIKQGDLITIMLESSSFRITAQGRAMENGINGQIIKVINTSSMREVLGQIIDEKTVKISFQ